MARVRSQLGFGPQRYSLDARNSVGPKRVAWRRRTKRAQIQKTPMEKARIAATRKARKALYNNAFTDPESTIVEHAQKISEKFGLKDTDSTYRELMQRSRIASTKRSKSRWNAFLREEVKKRNDGMYTQKDNGCISDITDDVLY